MGVLDKKQRLNKEFDDKKPALMRVGNDVEQKSHQKSCTLGKFSLQYLVFVIVVKIVIKNCNYLVLDKWSVLS